MSFGCVFASIEHVDACADAVVVERRFEDRLAAAGRDQRTRRVDGGAQSALEAHEVAAAFAVELARELADRVARREQRQLIGRGLVDELRAIGLEPQLAPALSQRQQLGFREGDRRAHGGRSITHAVKIARMPNLMQAARAAKLSTIVAVCLVAGHAGVFGQAAPAAPEAQSADAMIRTRIEELRVTGALVAQGEPLASRNLLSRIYENREFDAGLAHARASRRAARDDRRQLSRRARS